MLLAQCPVCQECFTGSVNCIISALPCGHVFHKVCVDKWLKTSMTCPQCRIEVKRSAVLQRLYFDILSYTPSIAIRSDQIDACLTDLEDSSADHEKFKSKKLSVEIHRLHADNIRLRDNLKSMEEKLEEITKTITSRDKEISAISSLYSETDKLYEKERQRCRELKTEISSLRQFLRDAENMKTETISLRKELDDMKSIKKLISASEENARDLLSRYTNKTETPSTSRTQCTGDLASLCKWAAVLRTELTASREKARSYRSELARVRKFQVGASQRIAKAESKVEELKEYAAGLEKQLSTVMSHCQSSSSAKVDNENIETKFTDSNGSIDLIVSPNSANDSVVSNVIDLTTPDLLSLSPSDESSIKLSAKLRTPSINPFGLKVGDLNDNHKRKTDSEFKPFLFSPTGYNSITKPNTPILQRRPSSLYQMAIMRQHAKAPSYSLSNKPVTSDLPTSGQTTRQILAPPVNKMKSFPDSRQIQFNPCLKRSSRTLKRTNSDITRSSKLDGFVFKL